METPQTIELIAIDKIIPYARNSRTHSEAQVTKIAASIKEFGFTNPVLIDKADGIIAGHGRVLAALKLGLHEVPCIRLGHLTDTQKRAYVIADNRLALDAGWDNEMLKIELDELEQDGFDISLTGFDVGELMTPDGIGESVDALDSMPVLPDGDKEPFQQKTFTLHDEQANVVDDAIALARTNPLSDTGINENSNGNALTFICSEFLRRHE